MSRVIVNANHGMRFVDGPIFYVWNRGGGKIKNAHICMDEKGEIWPEASAGGRQTSDTRNKKTLCFMINPKVAGRALFNIMHDEGILNLFQVIHDGHTIIEGKNGRAKGTLSEIAKEAMKKLQHKLMEETTKYTCDLRHVAQYLKGKSFDELVPEGDSIESAAEDIIIRAESDDNVYFLEAYAGVVEYLKKLKISSRSAKVALHLCSVGEAKMRPDIRKIANKVLDRQDTVSFENLDAYEQDKKIEEAREYLVGRDGGYVMVRMKSTPSQRRKFWKHNPEDPNTQLWDQKGRVLGIPVRLVFELENSDNPALLKEKDWADRIESLYADTKKNPIIWSRPHKKRKKLKYKISDIPHSSTIMRGKLRIFENVLTYSRSGHADTSTWPGGVWEMDIPYSEHNGREEQYVTGKELIEFLSRRDVRNLLEKVNNGDEDANEEFQNLLWKLGR